MITRRTLLAGCLATTLPSVSEVFASETDLTAALDHGEQKESFGRYFSDRGTIGTSIIYEPKSKKLRVFNRERAKQRFKPASTFKILNSLIGLETGVVLDVDTQIFRWDGVARPELPGCDEDMNLRRAIRLSCVPVYQQIARSVGAERYIEFLRRLNYGNADIGGAPVDRFWLEGNLAISPIEQIAFLENLYFNNLPFTKSNIEKVKSIIEVERGSDYVLRAKTGWAERVTPQVGWWVGWVEKQDRAYIFATNIEIRSKDQLSARAEITRLILKELSIL